MKSTDITNIYMGSTQGSKLFLGDELVWPISGPTPPTPTGSTYTLNTVYHATANTLPPLGYNGAVILHKQYIQSAYNTDILTKAELSGGTEIPINTTYTEFTTSGNNIVNYTFTGSTLTPNLFMQTDLVSIAIPSGVTEIQYDCFWGCNRLTAVTISDSVTTIGSEAFGQCILLPTITIPSGVTSIGVRVFSGCTGMQEMIFQGTTPPTLGSDGLGNLGFTFPIYVPDASVAAYKSAYSSYASRIYPISERIPTTYQRLQYFESTGADYIVADYPTPGFNEMMWAEYEFRLTQLPSSTNQHVLSGNNYRFGQIDSAGNWKVYRGGNNATITTSPFTTGVTRKYTFFKSNDEILVNGNVVGTLSDPAIMGSADSIQPRFFSVNGSNDSATFGARGYLYRVKIGTISMDPDEEVLEAYYVPAQRKSDNVKGLYDLVNSSFIPANS